MHRNWVVGNLIQAAAFNRSPGANSFSVDVKSLAIASFGSERAGLAAFVFRDPNRLAANWPFWCEHMAAFLYFNQATITLTPIHGPAHADLGYPPLVITAAQRATFRQTMADYVNTNGHLYQ